MCFVICAASDCPLQRAHQGTVSLRRGGSAHRGAVRGPTTAPLEARSAARGQQLGRAELSGLLCVHCVRPDPAQPDNLLLNQIQRNAEIFMVACPRDKAEESLFISVMY